MSFLPSSSKKLAVPEPLANTKHRRWLTHSISDYYGLESRSVTIANPSRRVVYVGVKQVHPQAAPPARTLPRPLWELC